MVELFPLTHDQKKRLGKGTGTDKGIPKKERLVTSN